MSITLIQNDTLPSKTKELKLRKGIWGELKTFAKVGFKIEYLETKPEIFYSSKEMSNTLENIISKIKAM
jgi:hypothetical protein